MAKQRKKSRSRTSSAAPTKRKPPRTVAARPRKEGAEKPAPPPGLVVAGVGASAGGLEAFSQLLQSLPRNPGLAIVLVQHLAPQHESALAFLLSSRTPMSVVQATEGMSLERDHVYVIPPNAQMGVRDGRLHLSPRPTDRSQYTPIDYFLRSLAETYQEHAIAVILSGTASDGTVGVREVKAAGGITIAQSPETAKYDGMPRAAIATGLVDLVVVPTDIAHELVRIAAHPLRAKPTAESAGDEETPPRDSNLEEVFSLLRSATGVDFRRYKRPTIERRLHRRMVLQRLTKLDQYVRLLREQPGEVNALYQGILIHVTRFFRDPESFDEIARDVLPKIVDSHREDEPIRIWVPGCATGEEAYSVAILLIESLGSRSQLPVQIFATDVSESAIEQARTGIYPATIESDVSPARLKRFFTRADAGYKVAKQVRDLCIFARQDLTRDPPFSNLDVVFCRNVLIYLGLELQKRLMNVFHYALKPTGYLVLGSAETIGIHSDLFGVADKKHRIYRKKLATVPEQHVHFDYTPAGPVTARPEPEVREQARSIQAEVNRVIQDRYAPPGVVVDTDLHVVQFRGQTGAYLEPAPGEPSVNVLKMAREGLLHGLRSALVDARRSKGTVRRSGIRVKSNGGWREIDIEVLPIAGDDRRHFLILFCEKGRGRSRRSAPADLAPREPQNRQIARLQQELASSREYLQSIIQDLEAANEELQSANEEVLSANEELQSTNEELDTAKEELQSTNEELNTVNEELHARNDELSRLNSDLMNLLGSVQIAIVIVSSDLRIRRFTPMAEEVLNLIASDIGRPIGHIKPNIECPDLEDMIARVIDTVTPVERDVQGVTGRSYALRIRPYKNVENRIDGAVLSLFEANAQAPAERQASELARSVLELVRQPVVVMDGRLRVQTANRAFCEAFDLAPRDVEGRRLDELGDGTWNIPAVQTVLERVARDGEDVTDVRVEHQFPGIGARRLVLNARRVSSQDGREPLVLLAIADIAG